MAYAQLTLTTSPSVIVPANNARRQLIVQNLGGGSVYIGPDSSISSTNTVKLQAGALMTIDDRFFLGALYGVTSSGTVIVGYWEFP